MAGKARQFFGFHEVELSWQGKQSRQAHPEPSADGAPRELVNLNQSKSALLSMSCRILGVSLIVIRIREVCLQTYESQ